MKPNSLLILFSLVIASLITIIVVMAVKYKKKCDCFGWRGGRGWRGGWRGRGWGPYRGVNWGYPAYNEVVYVTDCNNGCCNEENCRLNGSCTWRGSKGELLSGEPSQCIAYRDFIKNTPVRSE